MAAILPSPKKMAAVSPHRITPATREGIWRSMLTSEMERAMASISDVIASWETRNWKEIQRWGSADDCWMRADSGILLAHFADAAQTRGAIVRTGTELPKDADIFVIDAIDGDDNDGEAVSRVAQTVRVRTRDYWKDATSVADAEFEVDLPVVIPVYATNLSFSFAFPVTMVGFFSYRQSLALVDGQPFIYALGRRQMHRVAHWVALMSVLTWSFSVEER